MNAKQQPGGRRLDGYVRVSSIAGREGDNFISVEVQEERIRAWAIANGHEIIAMHHELDVSGGTMDRPKLNEVMARIDAGETDGVVVFNLSRFARTMVGSFDLINRINEKGALFASVSDGFDITTITGRMVLGILLSITNAERERIGENWLTSKVHALSRGIHISAGAPFGYKRGQGPVNPKTGRPAPAPLEVDPERAWAVPELFRRRAAGESWESLRRWLIANEVPTVRGSAWSGPTVRVIIRNRVYLGEARGAGHGLIERGAHEALVDEATWQAAQSRGTRFASDDAGALLRGLVRCGSCRYTMLARFKKNGTVSYFCHGRVGCPERAHVYATGANGAIGLDAVVVELVKEWERAREDRLVFAGFDPVLDIEADQKQHAELVAARERDRLDEELRSALGGRQEWLRHLADLTERINEKQAEIDEKQRQLGRPDGQPHAEFWEKWESGEMSLEEKRAHLASVIQAVFVDHDAGRGRLPNEPLLRRRRLADRVQIVWADEPLLTGIPRQGRAGYRVTPWPFPDAADADPDEVGVMPLQPGVEDAGEAIG